MVSPQVKMDGRNNCGGCAEPLQLRRLATPAAAAAPPNSDIDLLSWLLRVNLPLQVG